MNFTRQDLLKISAYLSKQSVKDSLFEKVDVVKFDTGIPVLQDGQNKMSTVSQLMGFVQSNFSLAGIPISISDLNSTNLLDAIGEIWEEAKVNGSGNYPDVINAQYVNYANGVGGYKWTKVSGALDYITGVFNGLFPYPNAATNTDINQIFN